MTLGLRRNYRDGDHRGSFAEIQTQDEGGPAEGAGPAVSSLLLPAAGAAAVHAAPEQVKCSCTPPQVSSLHRYIHR